MPDILGPASAQNAVTVRPSETRVFGATDTWFVDCTSVDAEDGTEVQAAWLNAIAAQLRTAIDQGGVTRDNADDMLARAIRALAPSVPVGTVAFFAAQTPPSGWLKRDGSAVSRVTYAALFSIIGTTYGNGDGSTTFNLPDDRGRFERAWDNGAGVDVTTMSGTTVSGNPTITGLASTSFMFVGMPVSGTGIPGGATIATIGPNSVTLSTNATASNSGIPITFTGRGFGTLQADDLRSHTHTFDKYAGSSASNGSPATANPNLALFTTTPTSATGGAETRPTNRAYLPVIKF